jgi:hypothetical protein
MNSFLRKIFCAISFLLLHLLPNSKAQQADLPLLSQERVNTPSYGFNDTLFYKIDANGNTLWAWNFSAPFVNTPDFHRISNYTVSGDRIIVLGLQGDPMGMPGDYFLATFVFDTLGNMLDAHAVWIYNTRVWQLSIFKNAEKGAWIICSFPNNNGSIYYYLLKTDSLGLIDPAFPSPAYVLTGNGINFDFSMMPDSGYALVFSTLNSNRNVSTTLLSRISKEGSLLWTKIMQDADTTVNMIIYENVISSDSIGNIYMISSCDSVTPSGNQKRYIASKLDSLGNIIREHKWNSFPTNIYYFTQMNFTDNQLHTELWLYPGNAYYSMEFDSTLHNTCMGPDIQGDFIFQTIPLGTISMNRIPVNLSQNPIPITDALHFTTFQSNGDYCDFYTKLEETSPIENLQVWPNPASAVVHLKTKNPAQQIEKVELLSIDGKSAGLLSGKSGEVWSLDVSHLNQGLYLLKAKSDKEVLYKRFMILH